VNLEGVANYCRTKYDQGAGEEVLNEAKQFAVQALSSVAFQVNAAAVALQDFLNTQMAELELQAGDIRAAALVSCPSVSEQVACVAWRVLNAELTTRVHHRRMPLQELSAKHEMAGRKVVENPAATDNFAFTSRIVRAECM
jgi:hypothetical protein